MPLPLKLLIEPLTTVTSEAEKSVLASDRLKVMRAVWVLPMVSLSLLRQWWAGWCRWAYC